MKSLKTIPFKKMHGLGNSYIYIDRRQTLIPEEMLVDLSRAVANPYTGIGSDGLILVDPSTKGQVKMRIFNRDGSEGKTCGSGLRCVTKYLHDRGELVNGTCKIETAMGTVEAHLQKSQSGRADVSVNMGLPKLLRKQIPMDGDPNSQAINEPFEVAGRRFFVTAVSMGNPHAVFFTPSVDPSLHVRWGPRIETDPRFPERVNVEFVHVESSTSLRCFVWERGSGATQACGSGACASVVAAVLNGHCHRGEEVEVHLAGGSLQINWSKEGSVWMLGEAVEILDGKFNLETLIKPPMANST